MMLNYDISLVIFCVVARKHVTFNLQPANYCIFLTISKSHEKTNLVLVRLLILSTFQRLIPLPQAHLFLSRRYIFKYGPRPKTAEN